MDATDYSDLIKSEYKTAIGSYPAACVKHNVAYIGQCPTCVLDEFKKVKPFFTGYRPQFYFRIREYQI